jgi:glycerol-3-phosphate dehydrogenase
MKVLLYADAREKQTAEFEKQIQDQLPGVWLKQTNSLEGLTRELSQPLNEISVVVMVVPSLMILNGFFKLAPLLENKKLILILPGHMDQEAFSLCLQLHPSFITYMNDDMEDAFQVLRQIKQKNINSNYKTFKTIH